MNFRKNGRKNTKQLSEQDKIKEIGRRILELREGTTGFYHAACSNCLDIVLEYLEMNIEDWEEVGYRDSDGYLVLPKE